DVGDDEIDGGSVLREEQVDIFSRQLAGAFKFAALLVDCTAAALLERGVDIDAAGGEEFDGHAVDAVIEDAADAAGEEPDDLAGVCLVLDGSSAPDAVLTEDCRVLE